MKTLALMLLLATSTSLAQQGTIRGTIIDAKTGQAVPGASVSLVGTMRGVSSGPDGHFVLRNIPDGPYTLAVSMVGYQRALTSRLTTSAAADTTIEIRIEPVAIQTEPVVVTASRREQSLQEVPVSVSVVDAAGIQAHNTVSFDDALRYVSGVNMTEFQVNIRGSSGYNKGAGSRVLVLVDGIPMLTGDTGEINFESIAVDEIDRIEVVKSASSALYGSSALGGVINVISRRIADTPATRLSLFGGYLWPPSYNEWDWGGGARTEYGMTVAHEQRIGDVGIRGSLSKIQDDSHRRNDSKVRYNGTFKLEYDIAPAALLTFNAGLMDQRRYSFLYWMNLDSALVPPADQIGQTVHSTRFYLNSIYRQYLSATSSYALRGLWYRNHFADNVSVGGSESTSDVLRGEVQVTMGISADHLVTAGVEVNYDRVDATLFGARHGGGAAVYAQDEIRLAGQLRLTLGGRFDLQDVDSLSVVSQFNPKAALVYTPVPGSTFRGSVGRGFRAPTVAEAFTSTTAGGLLIVPNPSLRPERSWSFEVGGNQILSDFAVIDLALFSTSYSDLIESGFNASGQGQFNNVTDARVRGFEVQTSLELLGKALFCDVGYTYVYPEDLTANDILKYRPRHLLYASGHWHWGRFTLGGDFRYVSKVERIDEEFVTLGIVEDGDARVPITVVDCRMSADLSDLGVPLTASLYLKNLFQYNYVELIGNMARPRQLQMRVDASL